ARIFEDVTESRRASETAATLMAQLAKSERLQSLGTLAGGVAHAFNNILATVLANAEVVAPSLPGTGPARKAIDGILEAGERAKNLVGRMLAFARAEEPATAPVQVGPIVHEAVGLLRPMLPSHLELLVDEATGTPAALVDPAQLQH